MYPSVLGGADCVESTVTGADFSPPAAGPTMYPAPGLTLRKMMPPSALTGLVATVFPELSKSDIFAPGVRPVA